MSKPPFQRKTTEEEVATSFLFLASNQAAQMTRAGSASNGGIIVNG